MLSRGLDEVEVSTLVRGFKLRWRYK